MAQEELRIVPSSGNVFEDLELKDAEKRLAKAELASRIVDILEEKNINQTDAGEILGINQPKVSALVHGRLETFSMERLLDFLNRLDQDVKIVIKQKPKNRRNHGFLKIAFV